MIYSESELELYLIFSTCYQNPAPIHSRSIWENTTAGKDSFSTEVIIVEMGVLKWQAVSSWGDWFKIGIYLVSNMVNQGTEHQFIANCPTISGLASSVRSPSTYRQL